jgi:hypothetical protein
MRVLKGLLHLICCYSSMTLIYFAASYITQSGMFYQAISFDQNLCKWNVKSTADVSLFCTGASCGSCNWLNESFKNNSELRNAATQYCDNPGAWVNNPMFTTHGYVRKIYFLCLLYSIQYSNIHLLINNFLFFIQFPYLLFENIHNFQLWPIDRLKTGIHRRSLICPLCSIIWLIAILIWLSGMCQRWQHL